MKKRYKVMVGGVWRKIQKMRGKRDLDVIILEIFQNYQSLNSGSQMNSKEAKQKEILTQIKP